jgi:hypothetical protein
MDDLDELEDMLNNLEGGSDDLDDLLDDIAPGYKAAPPRRKRSSDINLRPQQSVNTHPPASDGQGAEMNNWDP